jgi:hypothetical protein
MEASGNSSRSPKEIPAWNAEELPSAKEDPGMKSRAAPISSKENLDMESRGAPIFERKSRHGIQRSSRLRKKIPA